MLNDLIFIHTINLCRMQCNLGTIYIEAYALKYFRISLKILSCFCLLLILLRVFLCIMLFFMHCLFRPSFMIEPQPRPYIQYTLCLKKTRKL